MILHDLWDDYVQPYIDFFKSFKEDRERDKWEKSLPEFDYFDLVHTFFSTGKSAEEINAMKLVSHQLDLKQYEEERKTSNFYRWLSGMEPLKKPVFKPFDEKAVREACRLRWPEIEVNVRETMEKIRAGKKITELY